MRMYSAMARSSKRRHGHVLIPKPPTPGRRESLAISAAGFTSLQKNVGSTCTFLGVIEKTSATSNGVIYRVNDFEKTKEREVGYTAKPVAASKIEMLDGAGPWDPAEVVYIFVSNPDDISKTGAPTSAVPMVQSYVDICINGCLEIDAMYRAAKGSFTREFISSTTGWNANWVNDRIRSEVARMLYRRIRRLWPWVG